MKNIIILTTGRTGSSILAGLLAQNNRYWVNRDSIVQRKGYPFGDFENPDLIELNQNLLSRLDTPNPSLHYLKTGHFDVQDLNALYHRAEHGPYEEFLETCEKNQPWLWKDPRLSFTMFFWSHFVNLANIQFVYLTRNKYEIFRSLSKRGIHYTKDEVFRFTRFKERVVESFFTAHSIAPLRIDYNEIWDRRALNARIGPVLGFQISRMAYENVIRPSTKKKESETRFFVRYVLGLAKLKWRRLRMREFGV